MKNCAFQYATGDGEIYEDTGLITMDEADALWQKYIPVFAGHIKDGRDPEMAIWGEMTNETDYHKTISHWRSGEFIMQDGNLYRVQEV